MPTIQTQDTIYTYAFRGETYQCRLRLYRDVPDGSRLIVVVSELVEAEGSYSNSGLSITACAAAIATGLRHDGIGFTTYIEHYPPRGFDAHMPECFDWVQFRWDGQAYRQPHWTHVTRAEVQRMVGARLKPQPRVGLKKVS